MGQAKHAETAAEDRIPFLQKLAYGCGAFANNTLAAAIGGMMIVLNLGLGMSPSLVGWLGAIPRLFDAFTDPLVGYASDNTRSRYGRRRPYIFFGAIASGLIFALLWQLPAGYSETFYFVYFLIGSLLFYLAYTIFATPWVALGYELTPDYHERTRLMGVQSFIGTTAYMISPYFLLFMNSDKFNGDQVAGASELAINIAVVVIILGIIPAIFLRERNTTAQTPKAVERQTLGEAILEFFRGAIITLRFGPFLKLCVATFMVFNGFMLIAAFQTYVIIFYVFGGEQKLGAEWAGHSGSIQAVASLLVIAFITWLATKIGKRKAFFIATSIAMLGFALKWFCYNPEYPWLLLLPAPLMAFSLAGLFTLMSSMMADVVDADELETGQRREGMYGSIFWWVVKLGMSAAILGGGILLEMTGFNVDFGANQPAETIQLMRICDTVIPLVTSAIAMLAVLAYDLTEDKAHQIRAELEQRRGKI